MERTLLLLSLLMYLLAPSKFSYEFCVVGVFVFFLGFFIIIRNDKKEKIGFNLLFSIAFFSANYIYPIFVYPIFPTFSIFSYEVNYNVISKATALATFAYMCYVYGYICQLKKNGLLKCSSDFLIVSNKQIRFSIILELLLLSAFVSSGGLEMFTEMYEKTGHSVNPIASFVYLIFYNFTLFVTIANINVNNKLLYVIILLICALLFTTGTRTLPLVVLSVLFCRFCQTRNLSYKKILLLLLVGYITLIAVGQFRGSSSENVPMENEELRYVASANDFIVVTRNLYDIYDHVQKDNVTYGVSELGYILAVIPFAQSMVISIFDLEPHLLRSEAMTTYWLFGKDAPVGLGTNIVGDVYLAFGFWGVMLLFYFLGRFVMYSRAKGQMGSWQYFLIYHVFISGAIFMCRGSFFYSLKNIVWTILFAYLFKKYEDHRKYTNR